ncbi:MAG: hypothetical protein IH892_00135 [Planctomycetes bacterium]|nr:hypothetical protein [Planctomycetota bacterium]
MGGPVLEALGRASLSSAEWTRLFAVYAGVSPAEAPSDTPAMLGRHLIVGDRLRFQPRFAVDVGVPYMAILALRYLPARVVSSLPDTFARLQGTDSIAAEFALSPDRQQVGTRLTQIYPSGDVLPENLLKIYLHFSAPMSRGESYRHIRLVHESGRLVDLPFLELDEELWDRRQQRLTLLLDPGRIKVGLTPREEVGAILEPGQRYTLHVDGAWLDAQGHSLVRSVEKAFRVTARDARSPDPRHWRLSPPPAGGREPLSVTFAESLDHALLSRLLTIRDGADRLVPGEGRVTDLERGWQFTPAQPWRPGHYSLEADPVLEDLAGNSIGRPFEVDLKAVETRPGPVSASAIPFVIH